VRFGAYERDQRAGELRKTQKGCLSAKSDPARLGADELSDEHDR
jgi:hypothetical protein